MSEFGDLARFPRDSRSGRELVHLCIERPEDLPAALVLPSPRFVLLLVWDASAAKVPTISDVATKLLAAGCVCACTWGSDCERVHDIFDECIVGDGSADPDTTPLIQTTWHTADSLEDALWFALEVAEPDPDVAAGCGTLLVLQIGPQRERSAAVRAALSDPRGFAARRGDGGS